MSRREDLPSADTARIGNTDISDTASDMTPSTVTVPAYARRPPSSDGRSNIQISMRVPAAWMPLLRERARAVSEREERTITPQEIMRRMIAAALVK